MVHGAAASGKGISDGRRVRGATFLLLFNAHHEALDFTLPPDRPCR